MMERSILTKSDETVPFASVVNFTPTRKIKLDKISSYADFESFMAKQITNKNGLVAVRFSGQFKSMKTRSVARQENPYSSLVKATKNQSEFFFQDIEGDLVGFLLPKYIKGINVPGWHLHFVDKDRKCGGHVLDFAITSGELEVCEIYEFKMILPQASDVFSQLDLNQERSHELQKVESSR